MTVLITGSSGFIGKNFIQQNSAFSIREIDLLTMKVADIDFKGIDSVLHLAALVHQMQGAPEDLYFKINRDLAFDVAKKAKEQGVKHFVFMSTAKVFGESTTGNKGWDENSICNPQDAYGKSKLEAEKLIKSIEDDNFKIAIVRSPLVYGIGVKANMFNLIKLIDKYPILPLGGIDNKRSMVFVNNLIALIQLIIKQKASGVFIAGDEKPLSTTELAQTIANQLQKKVSFLKVPNFILKILSKIKPNIIEKLYGSLELNNLNTNSVLSFVPPFKSDEGIREMVEWYKLQKKN